MTDSHFTFEINRSIISNLPQSLARDWLGRDCGKNQKFTFDWKLSPDFLIINNNFIRRHFLSLSLQILNLSLLLF
jgi:hypothetical protein